MLLIVFLVPGFVWRTVEGQFVYLDRRLEWEKMALGLLTRSTLLYLPYAAILYKAWQLKVYDSAPYTVSWVPWLSSSSCLPRWAFCWAVLGKESFLSGA